MSRLAGPVDRRGGRRATRVRGHGHDIELDQFIGPSYLVTVLGPINPVVRLDVALRETRAVRRRIDTGWLRPATAIELSYAIVSALTRHQEDYIEAASADVWRLEQQVTGGQIDDPDEFPQGLFRARHGPLGVRTTAVRTTAVRTTAVRTIAVRTLAALSGAIYGRMAQLARVAPEEQRLVADIEDQFDRVRSVADSEREYLQRVIESRGSPPGRRSSSPLPWSAPYTG